MPSKLCQKKFSFRVRATTLWLKSGRFCELLFSSCCQKLYKNKLICLMLFPKPVLPYPSIWIFICHKVLILIISWHFTIKCTYKSTGSTCIFQQEQHSNKTDSFLGVQKCCCLRPQQTIVASVPVNGFCLSSKYYFIWPWSSIKATRHIYWYVALRTSLRDMWIFQDFFAANVQDIEIARDFCCY